MIRRFVLLSVLLVASVTGAEMLHPSGGSAPLDGLPLRTEFGGIGVNGQTAWVDGKCLEAFIDSDGLMKTRTASGACGTGSGSPVPTQTPWDCGAGNGAQGMGASPACFVRATPDGRGTECSTSSCNLNASTTLNSKQICLADGSNCPAGASGTTLTADTGGTTTGSTVGLLGSADGIDTSRSGDDVTVTFDPTEVGSVTWGAGSNTTWTFNGAGASDPALDVSTGALILTGPTGVYVTKDGTNGVLLNGTTGVLAATGTGSIVADSATALAANGANCSAGQYPLGVDASGAVESCTADDDAPEAGDFTGITSAVTVGDGSQSTQDVTYSLSGSNDPTVQMRDGAMELQAGGPLSWCLNDTAQTGTGDACMAVTCSAGPACSATLSHKITGGTLQTYLQTSSAGAITIGDSNAGSITLTTDGTGNGEVVLPTGSIGSGEILDGAVAVADLASADFGSFTCNGTTCAVDTGAIGATELASTAVTPNSYTNANITVDADGRITAAADGTTFPSAFALYVDKSSSAADSASCGSIAKPCATINGAQSIIRTNNDNGFATCSLDNSLGCGRCSVTTSTQCNENSDCPGGETCTATNSVCSGLSKGTCTGPSKSYDIHIGVGDYYETLASVCSGGSNAGKLSSEATCATGGGTTVDHSPPSPGNILYIGNDTNLTRIISSDWATFDSSSRQGVNLTNLTLTNLASTNGSAFRSTTGWTLSFHRNVGYVFTGTDTTNSWGINVTGTGNYTDSFYNPLVFAFSTGGANANGIHLQTHPSNVCTGDVTRACDGDSDCVGAGSGDTCDLTTVRKSADFYIQGGQIQPTGASGLSGTGVWVEGIACGSSLNMILADLDISGSNGGAGTTTGLKVSRTSCNANSDATLKAAGNTRAIVRNVRIAGTHNPGLTDFDVPLSVDANSKVQVFGPFVYNSCNRSLGATTSLEYMNTSEFGGGPLDLGKLNCSAPSTPVDGECWYDAATDNRRECQGNGSTRSNSGIRTDATSCPTNVSDGKQGEQCLDLDDGALWVCATTDGTCNTAAEWRRLDGNMTMEEDISADTSSFAAATTDYTIAHLDQWTNSVGGTLLTFHGTFVTGGAGAKTFTCLMRNNGSTMTNGTRSVTADNNSPAYATLVIDVFYAGTINGTVDVRCQVDTGTTATVNAVALRRMTFDGPMESFATGVRTFLNTPSSANLAAAVTDETGTNKIVFSDSPAIVTPTIASFTNATHDHTNAAGGGQLSPPMQVCSGKVVTAADNTTRYMAYGVQSTAEVVVSAPYVGNTTATLKRLYCHSNGAPGSGKTMDVTVMANGSATSVTCQLTGTSNPATCNDTTHSGTITAGQVYSFKMVPASTPASMNLQCCFELDQPLG